MILLRSFFISMLCLSRILCGSTLCTITTNPVSLVFGYVHTLSRRCHGSHRIRNIFGAVVSDEADVDIESQEETQNNVDGLDQEYPSSSNLIFGQVRRIRMPGDDEEGSSFLGSMGVPTFASPTDNGENDNDGYVVTQIIPRTVSPKARGLEDVLGQSPAFVLDNVVTKESCEQMIYEAETIGFGNFQSGKNFHGALQILVSEELVDSVAQRIGPHIDIGATEQLMKEMEEVTKRIKGTTGNEKGDEEEEDVRLIFAGLNRRWRIYRYDPSGNETFAPHIDAGFPPSGLSKDGKNLLWDVTTESSTTENNDNKNNGEKNQGDEIVSRLTVLIYLNDDFVGGETKFYQSKASSQPTNDDDNDDDHHHHKQLSYESQVIASVRPKTGSVLVFPQGVGEEAVEHARQHWPLHEGSPVISGRPKYVIRSDVLFVTLRGTICR